MARGKALIAWRRLRDRPIEASLAASAAVIGVMRMFLQPPAGPIKYAIGELVYVWSAAYGVSGLAILFGLLRAKPKFESSGLIMFSVALTVQMLATAAIPRIDLFTLLSTVIFFLLLAIGTAVRGWNVATGKHEGPIAIRVVAHPEEVKDATP